MKVGQENFLAIARNYYRESTGCLVTFDITNRDSFASVAKWVSEVRSNTGPELVLVLVGTKADLAYKREVSQAEAEAYASSQSLPYIEVSAKEAVNVTQPFICVCKEVLRKVDKGVYDLTNEVSSTQRCVVKSGKKELTDMRTSMRLRPTLPDKRKVCC